MSNLLDEPWSIPNGWSWTTAGEVTDVVGGGTPRSDDSLNFDGGTIPWITPADLSGYRAKYISHGRRSLTERGLAESAARLLPMGTVLFSSRAPIGYVAIAANPVATNQGFKSLVPPPELDPEFLYYYLQRARSLAVDLASGTTFLEISGAKTEKLPLVVAPLPEQHRIVEAIESYFTRLDDAVATLERVQRNLKRYRASVLKAAVEGRLVPTEAELARAEDRDYEPASVLLERILAERRRRWQEAGGRGKYQEPVSPDTSDLPELPGDWCWATVDQLSHEVRYGSSAKAHEEQEGGVPVVRMGNIVDGFLDFTDLKYLLASHDEFPDLLLQPGDLLFNRTNSAELVGKTAVFHGQREPCSFASYLIRVRMLQGAHPDFVSHYINSLAGRAWIASVVSQQVGQANVNGTKLRACPVPLPPNNEQHRIVGEVDRLLSVAFAMAEAAAADHQRCQRLRQSILKWAFEGRLADQDPSDEPASALLERLRTETAARATSAPTGVPSKRRGRTGTMARTKHTK